MLEVDEDSRLGKEMLLGGARYGAAETPADDQVAEFYEMAVERLAGMGIPRYEISNFARPGFESRHNLKYWKLEPYVGFGADAHSFDGRARRQNPNRWRNTSLGAAAGARPPRAIRDEERFFVGLRLMEGIRPDARRVAALRRAHPPLSGCRPARNRGGVAAPDRPRRAAFQRSFQEFLDL